MAEALDDRRRAIIRRQLRYRALMWLGVGLVLLALVGELVLWAWT
jgi:hypothetical protein